MTYRVLMQPKAEQDIYTSAHWIMERSKSADTAIRWARRIRAKIDTLKTNPLRCPVDEDSDAFGDEVRILLFGKRTSQYLIFFSVDDDTIRVLTVRHSAQRSITEELADAGDE